MFFFRQLPRSSGTTVQQFEGVATFRSGGSFTLDGLHDSFKFGQCDAKRVVCFNG